MMKKLMGSLMAMMSILIIGSGAASVVAIGVEDMPKSLKGKR
jgi:hypothetical protein